MQTCFTTGSCSDTNIATLFYLLKDLSGWVFGDKGYLINEAKRAFVEYNNEVDFFAKPRNNAKEKSTKEIPLEAQKMAKKRPIIETVIGIQKMVMDLEHTRHRNPTNAFTHSLAAICAYSFYQRKPKAVLQNHWN